MADWDYPGAIYVYTPGCQTHTTFYSSYSSSLGEPEGIAFEDVALPVPEPSTLGLLALGAATLLARRVKLRN